MECDQQPNLRHVSTLPMGSSESDEILPRRCDICQVSHELELEQVRELEAMFKHIIAGVRCTYI